MLDKLKHITLGEVEYPLAFTLNVLENIQEKYGSLDAWTKAMEPENGEVQFKDLKWIFAEFINEGIDIENEMKNEKRKFVTLKQVGRIVSLIGLDGAHAIINTVASDSTPENEEGEEGAAKNE